LERFSFDERFQGRLRRRGAMGKIDQELWASGRPASGDDWQLTGGAKPAASGEIAGGQDKASRVFGASAASADPLASARTIDVVVKWFNAEKGYGFVELAGGRGDAFLHLKTLRLVGRETLPSGAKLRAVVTDGARGAQVVRVEEVDVSSVIERPDRAPRRPIPDPATAIDLTGKVKWFDGVRGFGFVASDDYGRDVFVHVTTLGAAGVSRISEGQAVAMRVVETPKGREAIAITL
jgi:cold shock protein